MGEDLLDLIDSNDDTFDMEALGESASTIALNSESFMSGQLGNDTTLPSSLTKQHCPLRQSRPTDMSMS